MAQMRTYKWSYCSKENVCSYIVGRLDVPLASACRPSWPHLQPMSVSTTCVFRRTHGKRHKFADAPLVSRLFSEQVYPLSFSYATLWLIEQSVSMDCKRSYNAYNIKERSKCENSVETPVLLERRYEKKLQKKGIIIGLSLSVWATKVAKCKRKKKGMKKSASQHKSDPGDRAPPNGLPIRRCLLTQSLACCFLPLFWTRALLRSRAGAQRFVRRGFHWPNLGSRPDTVFHPDG